MSRLSTIIGSALGIGLLAVATGASADARRPCSTCGPLGTTRYVRTIHPTLYVTRYHDRSVYDHVTRLRHVVEVTRVQPIIHVHDVTRVHHVTLVSARDVYAYPIQQWAPVTYLQPGPAAGTGCSCGDE